MFKLAIYAKHKNGFVGNIYKDSSMIGGFGQDEKGLFVNINVDLSLDETLKLLEMIKGINEELGKMNIDIFFVEQSKSNTL